MKTELQARAGTVLITHRPLLEDIQSLADMGKLGRSDQQSIHEIIDALEALQQGNNDFEVDPYTPLEYLYYQFIDSCCFDDLIGSYNEYRSAHSNGVPENITKSKDCVYDIKSLFLVEQLPKLSETEVNKVVTDSMITLPEAFVHHDNPLIDSLLTYYYRHNPQKLEEEITQNADKKALVDLVRTWQLTTPGINDHKDLQVIGKFEGLDSNPVINKLPGDDKIDTTILDGQVEKVGACDEQVYDLKA